MCAAWCGVVSESKWRVPNVAAHFAIAPSAHFAIAPSAGRAVKYVLQGVAQARSGEPIETVPKLADARIQRVGSCLVGITGIEPEPEGRSRPKFSADQDYGHDQHGDDGDQPRENTQQAIQVAQ